MKPEDVKKYYGSSYRFHKITGMSNATYCNWMKWGYVPRDAQYKLEAITKGALKADHEEREMIDEDANTLSGINKKVILYFRKQIKEHLEEDHDKPEDNEMYNIIMTLCANVVSHMIYPFFHCLSASGEKNKVDIMLLDLTTTIKDCLEHQSNIENNKVGRC
jgi:hypothetical protein